MTDETGRRFAWDCYFAGIMSINLHPGSGKQEHQQMTLEECAHLADAMLIARDKRFPKE